MPYENGCMNCDISSCSKGCKDNAQRIADLEAREKELAMQYGDLHDKFASAIEHLKTALHLVDKYGHIPEKELKEVQRWIDDNKDW